MKSKNINPEKLGMLLSILNEAKSYFSNAGSDEIWQEITAIIASFPDVDEQNAIYWVEFFIEALVKENYLARADSIQAQLDQIII